VSFDGLPGYAKSSVAAGCPLHFESVMLKSMAVHKIRNIRHLAYDATIQCPYWVPDTLESIFGCCVFFEAFSKLLVVLGKYKDNLQSLETVVLTGIDPQSCEDDRPHPSKNERDAIWATASYRKDWDRIRRAYTSRSRRGLFKDWLATTKVVAHLCGCQVISVDQVALVFSKPHDRDILYGPSEPALEVIVKNHDLSVG
jgi:hypothetical protein